jgi:hypothetical protein
MLSKHSSPKLYCRPLHVIFSPIFPSWFENRGMLTALLKQLLIISCFQNQSPNNPPGHCKTWSPHPQTVLVSIAAILTQLKGLSDVCGPQKKGFWILLSQQCFCCQPAVTDLRIHVSSVSYPFLSLFLYSLCPKLFDIIFLVRQEILPFASKLCSTSSLP